MQRYHIYINGDFVTQIFASNEAEARRKARERLDQKPIQVLNADPYHMARANLPLSRR